MNLRLVLVLLGITTLASCAPCNCNCSLETQERLKLRFKQLSFLSNRAAPTNVVTCEAGKDCELEVKVLVRDVTNPLDSSKKTTKCQVLLDYCTVCVRGVSAKSGSPPMKIIWRLVGEDGKPAEGYVFHRTTGIDIPYASATGKQDFYARQIGSSRQEFIWTAGPDASGLLHHEAHVYPKDGVDRCDPVDPDVINSN